MTNTSTFTAIKLCIIALTAAASVACGNTATSAPASPATVAYEDDMEPMSAYAHDNDVTFEVNESAVYPSRKHEAPATVGMNDVTPTSLHTR